MNTDTNNRLKPAVRRIRGASRGRLVIAAFLAAFVVIAPASAGPNTPPPPQAADASMQLVTEGTGARAYWKAGFTGKGVDIAIIDSGVAPVEGLSAPGKVILGPDLSFESQDPSTRYIDTNGHGSHLAAIIAGRDSTATGDYANDKTSFLGMAPDARLVSLKVADARGNTDVSQVIAAINWVVQHKNDNGLNIRVLTIAFGTDSAAGWQHDPLVFAAEQAWKQGIFVVVSAGNDGPNARQIPTLSNLASSPNLMVMGASDMLGTPSYSDDVVPPFSSGGNSSRWVDLVAPGTHIVSLAVPGSSVADTYSTTGAVGGRFFRGSGTSQAAAVASGAAALVIQERPDITPSQLKNLLKTRAQLLTHESMSVQGAGGLTLLRLSGFRTPRENAGTNVNWSDGLATLESSRGSHHLSHNGITLAGELDIFAARFDSGAMAAIGATASSWSGGMWNANQWTASSWSDYAWASSSWSTSSWSASSWSSSSWSASSWSASSWSASSWSASSWSASSWSSASWN